MLSIVLPCTQQVANAQEERDEALRVRDDALRERDAKATQVRHAYIQALPGTFTCSCRLILGMLVHVSPCCLTDVHAVS